MPSAMVRKDDTGKMLFYIAKKDLEDVIVSVERDTADEWGGVVTLGGGETYFIDPISPPPTFPKTLRFKRAE